MIVPPVVECSRPEPCTEHDRICALLTVINEANKSMRAKMEDQMKIQEEYLRALEEQFLSHIGSIREMFRDDLAEHERRSAKIFEEIRTVSVRTEEMAGGGSVVRALNDALPKIIESYGAHATSSDTNRSNVTTAIIAAVSAIFGAAIPLFLEFFK